MEALDSHLLECKKEENIGEIIVENSKLWNHVKTDHKNNKNKSMEEKMKKITENKNFNKKISDVDPLAITTKVNISLVNLDLDLTLNVPKEPQTITLDYIKKNYMPEKDIYIYYAKTFDEKTGIRFFEHWEDDLKILPVVDGQITLKCYS